MGVHFARALGTVAAAVSICLLVLAPAAFAAPANDDFANAQTVGPVLPAVVPASNVGATAQVGEPDIGGNAVVSTVWFKWTAPATGPVVVDLCAAGFTGSEYSSEYMAVRTGAAFPLTLVAERTGECNLRFNALAAMEYKIQVDYRSYEGNFNFRLRQMAPPTNDMFATPKVIGLALPVSLNTTNVDSTWEAGEPPSLGGSSQSRSVWFSWTAPSTGRARLDICQSTGYSGAQNKTVEVYTGNTLATLAVIASGSSNCTIDFPHTAGVTYRIAVSGSIVGEFTFVLKLKNAPPPANDNFANAITVGPSLPVSIQGENEFATAETGEPDHNDFGSPQHSAWYKWTPAQNAKVRIKTCGETFDARLGVYTGAAINALTSVGVPPPYGPYCHVTLAATAGTTYWIAAAGGPQDGASGAYLLDIHVLKVPANDDFADAPTFSATLPSTIAGTTVDATFESSEPSHTLEYGGSYTPSVWYRWTSPTDEATIFSACSTTVPTRLAVYSGTVLNDLSKLAAADVGCAAETLGGRLAIAPVKGQTYMIAVASTDRDFESNFTLSSKGPTLPPVIKPPVIKPPKPGFNLKKAIKKCKKIKGKGVKAKRKRARCIKRAKKTAAIIKCKKLKKASKRNKCIKKARKKFR